MVPDIYMDFKRASRRLARSPTARLGGARRCAPSLTGRRALRALAYEAGTPRPYGQATENAQP